MAIQPAWQPTATAPKDGTRVILCRKLTARFKNNKRIVIGFWVNRVGFSSLWRIESHGNVYARDSDLEGWMPLPAPTEEGVVGR